MKSVRNALTIFEEIARRQPVGHSALVFRTRLPASTVHRCLHTLAEAGWIHRSGDSRPRRRGRPERGDEVTWVVSAHMGSLIANPYTPLVEVARPVMEQLRDSFQESVSLSVLDGNDIVIVAHVESSRALRVVNVVGWRGPARATSVGKAIAALLPLPAQERLAYSPAHQSESMTVPGPEQFLEGLETVRELGYATMLGEVHPSAFSVAAAIFDCDYRPVAGIEISAAPDEFTEEDILEFGSDIRDAAKSISNRLARLEIRLTKPLR